jgi:hypothetical protein
MALDVLYGPADIALGGTPVVSATGFMWLQGIGLLAVLDPATAFGFYAVQLDGSVQGPRSSYNGSGFTPVLDIRSIRGLAVGGGGSLYTFDWLVGQKEPVPILTATGVASINVIAADRYLHFSSGTPMQALASTDGITFTAEYTFPTPAGYTLVNVSRGRSTTEVCVTYSNGSLGQIRFYDTVGKAQVGDTLYLSDAPEGCWCVPKYNIFVELKSLQLKILADSIAPATLSNPVASPAAGAGLVSQVSVQLLGAQSEPCVGELIDWSIASGTGDLAVPQSATDETGTAINLLIVPIGSAGSVVVDAQLSY